MKHLLVSMILFTIMCIALDTVFYNAYRWCKNDCSTCGNWMCKYAWTRF